MGLTQEPNFDVGLAISEEPYYQASCQFGSFSSGRLVSWNFFTISQSDKRFSHFQKKKEQTTLSYLS